MLKFRSNFQHHVILIQAFVNVRDLALAKGVAKSIVNVLHSDAKPAGRVAVDDYGTLQPMHLLVGVDVAELWNSLEALHDDGRSMRELAEIVCLQRVLILSAAETAAHADVLNGLQVQPCPGNFGSLRADARDHLINA